MPKRYGETKKLLERREVLASGLPAFAEIVRGSLVTRYRRCGKPTCHCADGPRHPVWSLTFMVRGKKHVQHIPKDLVDDVRRRVEAGRQFQDAVREVLAANAQLLVLARQQGRKQR